MDEIWMETWLEARDYGIPELGEEWPEELPIDGEANMKLLLEFDVKPAMRSVR